jgi:RNA polymerase sigma factor (sigma-70 family)
VTEQTLARARAGDEDAFRELTDPYRRELQVHIYRVVGSTQDAEDLLQETLLAAWRGLEQFEGRASVRAWLHRIATNRALDALRASRRRPDDVQRMTEPPAPTRRAEPISLQPYPDVLLEGIPDDALGPQARYEAKEAIELAFIAGLQHLPPQQRAVLVLRDVLGYRASEVAEMLEASEPSVNSLLRRARATFESRLPATGRERAPLPNSKRERDIVGRFADARRGRRRRRHGGPAHRRRLADDAAVALGIPGPRRDQRVPALPRGRARHAAAPRTNACEPPARLRVLHAVCTNGNRTGTLACRPHAGGRPDIRAHLVPRHQPLPALRTAARAAVRKAGTRSWMSLGKAATPAGRATPR